jgi:hypothetical protein
MWRFIFVNVHAKTFQMEQRAIIRILTFKSFKAKKIETKHTNMYEDEALQISAVKK